MSSGMMPAHRFTHAATWLIFALVAVLTLFGVRSEAGSWNDLSRLATVESLVDYHTLAIDRSIFTPDTYDKVFVAGHFYSEKSPVPAVWQALVYWLLQVLFGLHAQSDPAVFCYLIGLTSSGLAYVLAVVGAYCMGRRLQLSPVQTLLLTSSFALATLAPVYMRNVNSHIMLLAAVCWLMAGMIAPGPYSWQRALGLGTLAGLAYTIDLGVGPVFLMGSGLFMCWKGGSIKTVVIFTLAALPPFLLHHVLNYAIGQTIGPVAAQPEFQDWQGSKFPRSGMTGTLIHPDFHSFVIYAVLLLVGPRGFLTYQPTLWLALLSFGILLWKRVAQTPSLALAGFWCLGSWLIYAVGSNNYAGECCSIRWFVPLLAPAYFVLALMLVYLPDRWADLCSLSVFGMFVAAVAWVGGPWIPVRSEVLWAAEAGALLSWIALRVMLSLMSRKRTIEPGQN